MWQKLCLSLFLATCLFAHSSGAALDTPETFIIGGNEVNIASHPYLVSIRYRDTAESGYLHKCAGVIYNERCVITSAQCIQLIGSAERVMAVAGANRRVSADGYTYPISKWAAHQNFSTWTGDYDIGLLISEIPFDLEHFLISTIEVTPERPPNGKYGTVAGWGYREEFGPSSNQLEHTQVPIVSTEECTQAYGPGEITARMICAGLRDGGRDACQGDTGGPLVIANKLVGLVSWGRGCARPGYPGVYTYVPSLKNWIDETYAANV